MKHSILRFGPVIIVIGIIFIASSTPGSDMPDMGYLDLLAKKGGHLAGYALLGAAGIHAWISDRQTARSGIVKAGILVVLHALLDEWHQSFIPGRNPSLVDVCIDIAGGGAGIALFSWTKQKRRKPPEPDKP